MANKHDRFGLRFCLALDAQNKHYFKEFPHVGKDDILKLMGLPF